MRRGLYVALGYLGLMAIWIYWVLERQLFYGNDTASWLLLAGLIVAHVAAGALVARWWALALPALAVLLAVPAGYPDANKGEPLPISLGLALFSPLALLLVATGVGLPIALRVHTARAR
jgi:peptidoglycan/LPS O-acetylase OafA/YrhL